MRWTEYAVVMLLFSLVTMLVTYAIERLQHLLPLNPQHLAAVAPDLALNTAASFTTNTNWQSYVPETTMSYLTQMLTLAYHNFFSASVGIALAIAFIRGISRRESKTLGNFWVDTTRASLWCCSPGASSTLYFSSPRSHPKLPSLRRRQTRPIAICNHHRHRSQDEHPDRHYPEHRAEPGRLAGGHQDACTNGGGFFNTNSAHPFENPTPSRTSWRCSPSFSSPRPSRSPSAA